MPCNWNQRELARHVRRGILEAGGTPVEFNTIAVSDGVSMGTEGMRASLVSRETIADSIELVVRGHLLDGLVCLVGCDKTIPAAVMALARLDVPGLVALQRLDRAGPLPRPRRHHPGRLRGGRRSRRRDDVERRRARARGRRVPRAPARAARQFTANTMATVLEFLGISPAGLNDVPATDPAKTEAAYEAGRIAMRLVRDDVRPSQIMTRDAIENAVAAVAATGGSTNGVLHLLAIARELDIPLELDDFDRIAERTPVVADIKPGGRFVAVDLHAAGGVALVARELLKAGLVHGDAPNVDGRSLAEVATAVVETPGQEVVVPIERPLKATGGLAILRGNLAPERLRREARRPRAAASTAGRRASSTPRRTASPPSRRARSRRATSSSSATKAPPAAPACARCCTSPPRSSARGSGRRSRSSPTAASRARRTGSWSATSRRRPRAAGRSRRSATATSSSSTSTGRRLQVELTDDEIAARLADVVQPPPRYTKGVLARYAKHVSSASEGAVLG